MKRRLESTETKVSAIPSDGTPEIVVTQACIEMGTAFGTGLLMNDEGYYTVGNNVSLQVNPGGLGVDIDGVPLNPIALADDGTSLEAVVLFGRPGYYIPYHRSRQVRTAMVQHTQVKQLSNIMDVFTDVDPEVYNNMTDAPLKNIRDERSA